MRCDKNEALYCNRCHDFQCSDITNTLVGISGETAPVVRIYVFIE